MSEVVDHLAELTGFRDRDVLGHAAHAQAEPQRARVRARDGAGGGLGDEAGIGAVAAEQGGERAATREGVLQVELAHLNYQKGRLVRSWTHLERQRGSGGFGHTGTR